jgi:hypothetical protein
LVFNPHAGRQTRSEGVSSAFEKPVPLGQSSIVNSPIALRRRHRFDLGDIPLGVWAYRWFNLPIERPKFANFDAWYKRLCERPAYQKHIMIPLT